MSCPDFVRSHEPSRVNPGWYLDGKPPRKSRVMKQRQALPKAPLNMYWKHITESISFNVCESKPHTNYCHFSFHSLLLTIAQVGTKVFLLPKEGICISVSKGEHWWVHAEINTRSRTCKQWGSHLEKDTQPSPAVSEEVSSDWGKFIPCHKILFIFKMLVVSHSFSTA